MLIYIYLFLFLSQPDRDSLGKSDGTGLTVKDKLNQSMDEEENFRDFFSLTSPFCLELSFTWSLLRGQGMSVSRLLPDTGIESG